MIDIESPMQDTSNLRNRKQQNFSHNQKLIRRFNQSNKYNYGDDDDSEDEAEKTIRKLALQHQIRAHQNVTNTVMKLVTTVVVVFIFIYLYLMFGVSEQNEHSPLVKALRILVGTHKTNLSLPAGTKLFSVTSVSRDVLNDLVYPSWPWSKSSVKYYLIPNETLSQKPVGRIMKRILNYKSDFNVDVTLFSNDDISAFLKHDVKCGEVSTKHMTMLQRYEELGRYGAKDGQRILLTWCILYTGQAYAAIDLDRYDIIFRHRYIYDVKSGKIKNAYVNVEGCSDRRNTWESMLLATSIIVLKNHLDSKVPRSMLQFLLDYDIKSEKALLHDANENMITLIHAEAADWTELNVHCENATPESCIINICQSFGNCWCILPSYQDTEKKINNRKVSN